MSDLHGLTDQDRALLDFEGRGWRHAWAKDDAIRDELGYSVPRYYQLLNVLIEKPEALAAEPMLVKRLLRARNAHTVARLERSFVPDERRIADERRIG